MRRAGTPTSLQAGERLALAAGFGRLWLLAASCQAQSAASWAMNASWAALRWQRTGSGAGFLHRQACAGMATSWPCMLQLQRVVLPALLPYVHQQAGRCERRSALAGGCTATLSTALSRCMAHGWALDRSSLLHGTLPLRPAALLLQTYTNSLDNIAVVDDVLYLRAQRLEVRLCGPVELGCVPAGLGGSWCWVWAGRVAGEWLGGCLHPASPRPAVCPLAALHPLPPSHPLRSPLLAAYDQPTRTAPLSSTFFPPPCPPPSPACQDGTYTSGRLNSRPNGGLYPGMVLPDGRTAGSVHVEASIQVRIGAHLNCEAGYCSRAQLLALRAACT